MRFNYMICPVQDLATNILSDMKCTPNRVFIWRDFHLPASVSSTLSTLVRLLAPPSPKCSAASLSQVQR